MSRAKNKLSLNRETLRVLNAVEVTLVAGAGANWGFTNSPGCEKTGVVGHCEQPSRAPGNCGTGDGQPFPRLTVQQPGNERTRLQPQSLSYCLNKSPMSGYTVPPTAMD
jgi:hypothetical protein